LRRCDVIQIGGEVANRILAILIGIAIIFLLDRWWLAPWYVYLPLGAIGYGFVRYIGYFVRERQYINRTMAEAEEAARRGRSDATIVRNQFVIVAIAVTPSATPETP
jgi:hypothetical protein